MKIEMNTENKTLREGYQEYLKYCMVRDCSESTIINYRTTIAQFNKFYSESNLINSLNKNTIEDYICYLRENTSMSNVSISIWLQRLKALFNYFAKNGYMEQVEFPVIRCEKKVKETYTDEELKLLLEKPKLGLCNFTEYRNWVMINYLLSTGNRRNTLVNIKISDIDFDGGFIKLTTTKNKRQQYIPLSATLSKILKDYLKHRGGKPDDYLFCDACGDKLNTDNLRISLNRYHKRRGVEKTSIHLYRHTFAKKWILAGGDIFRLQKILGHSSLDVVKEYVEMFTDDLQKDFDKFNALEQIQRKGDRIKF